MPRSPKKQASPKRRGAPKKAPRAVARPRTRNRSSSVEAKYVRAVFDPFGSEPARFPDMLSSGTSVTSSTTRFTLTSMQGGASTMAYVGVTAFAHVGNTASILVSGCKAIGLNSFDVNGSGAGNLFRYDPLHGTVNNAGAAYTNWSTYRTVGMGLRVRNVTPLLYRGGVAGTRTRVAANAETIESFNVPEMLSARNTAVYDAATCPANGWNVVWQPNNYTDLSFLLTNDTNYSPALQFCWSGDFDPSHPQTFEIEVRTLYEFRPIDSVQYLFDMEAAYGSPARVEGMAADVVSKAGEPAAPGFADRAIDAVIDVVGAPVEIAAHVRNLVREKSHSVMQPFRAGRLGG